VRDGESVGTRNVKSLNRSTVESAPRFNHSTIQPFNAFPPHRIRTHQANGRSRGFTDVPGRRRRPCDVVLSLENLGCSESGVREVTFNIRSGEILGLAGLIGAGRTELARILSGSRPRTLGEIIFNGQHVTIASPQDAVAHGIALCARGSPPPRRVSRNAHCA